MITLTLTINRDTGEACGVRVESAIEDATYNMFEVTSAPLFERLFHYLTSPSSHEASTSPGGGKVQYSFTWQNVAFADVCHYMVTHAFVREGFQFSIAELLSRTLVFRDLPTLPPECRDLYDVLCDAPSMHEVETFYLRAYKQVFPDGDVQLLMVTRPSKLGLYTRFKCGALTFAEASVLDHEVARHALALVYAGLYISPSTLRVLFFAPSQ